MGEKSNKDNTVYYGSSGKAMTRRQALKTVGLASLAGLAGLAVPAAVIKLSDMDISAGDIKDIVQHPDKLLRVGPNLQQKGFSNFTVWDGDSMPYSFLPDGFAFDDRKKAIPITLFAQNAKTHEPQIGSDSEANEWNVFVPHLYYHQPGKEVYAYNDSFAREDGKYDLTSSGARIVYDTTVKHPPIEEIIDEIGKGYEGHSLHNLQVVTISPTLSPGQYNIDTSGYYYGTLGENQNNYSAATDRVKLTVNTNPNVGPSQLYPLVNIHVYDQGRMDTAVPVYGANSSVYIDQSYFPLITFALNTYLERAKLKPKEPFESVSFFSYSYHKQLIPRMAQAAKSGFVPDLGSIDFDLLGYLGENANRAKDLVTARSEQIDKSALSAVGTGSKSTDAEVDKAFLRIFDDPTVLCKLAVSAYFGGIEIDQMTHIDSWNVLKDHIRKAEALSKKKFNPSAKTSST